MAETKNEIIKSIPAEHIAGSCLKWKIRLHGGSSILHVDKFVQFVSQSDGHQCLCPVMGAEETNDGIIIEVDLSPLKETVENCKSVKWKVYIEGSPLTAFGSMKEAVDRTKNQTDKYRRRFGLLEMPVGSFDLYGRIVELVPGCDIDGSWHITTGERCLRYMQAFKCVGLDAGIRRGRLFFKVACPVMDGFNLKGMVITYRYQLEKDRSDHFFPVGSVRREGGQIEAVTEIDLTGIDFRPIYWDIRMAFEKDCEIFWTNVRSVGMNKKASRHGGRHARLLNLIRKQSLKVTGDFQMSIGETAYGNTTVIVQQTTPYSGFIFRFKERLAILIYLVMRMNLQKKRIFLVYEKYCMAAQENGYYFFMYCMKNGMEEAMRSHIYYVIDKSQTDYEKLLPYKDHVIQFMSLRHMVYILAAKLLISSDSKLHSYAWRATESIIRPCILDNKKLVFLQHGVIGLKRVGIFKRGLPEGASLFITSNDMERGFIINELGYLPEEVAVTGLARWDVLEDKSGSLGQNRILIMPTWRRWLNEPTDETFRESEYYRRYMGLVNSEKIAEILEKYDLYLDFHIHPKLSDHLKQFTVSNDRIRLIPFGSEPLNELMMKCRLLITDYSSVCWDVYYQAKPVIFYQFDLAEYNETQGAYMDLKNGLFGDRAETQDELIALIKETVDNGFNLKPKYAKMHGDMYKHIDHNNSKRICEEIIKRGW